MVSETFCFLLTVSDWMCTEAQCKRSICNSESWSSSNCLWSNIVILHSPKSALCLVFYLCLFAQSEWLFWKIADNNQWSLNRSKAKFLTSKWVRTFFKSKDVLIGPYKFTGWFEGLDLVLMAKMKLGWGTVKGQTLKCECKVVVHGL